MILRHFQAGRMTGQEGHKHVSCSRGYSYEMFEYNYQACNVTNKTKYGF